MLNTQPTPEILSFQGPIHQTQNTTRRTIGRVVHGTVDIAGDIAAETVVLSMMLAGKTVNALVRGTHALVTNLI